MSTFYWPPTGGAGGIPIYPTFASFPVTGLVIGDLAVAADSGIIYEWRGSSWVAIAAPGDVLSIGVFGSTPNADGLSITTNVLQMQPASASFPGGVSTSAQTFAGTKSFQTILAATDDTYDVGATASRFKNGYFSTSLSVGTYPLSPGNTYTALTAAAGFPAVYLYAGGSNVYRLFSDGNGLFLNNSGTGTSMGQFYDDHFAFSDGSHLYLTGNATGVVAYGTLSASNLSGTNTGDVTLGTANGLSLSAQVLSLGLSSTSTTGALSSTDWNTFNGKQASGSYITALTGDGTASGPGSAALTLATVNANVGSFGSSTAIPSFTVNGKGLITAASTNVVVAPAGTLTGTALASNVVTSSLTTVGTIGTGVWQGTAVAATYGGTGIDTHASTGYPSISSGTWSVASAANTFITLWETVATTGGDIIYGGASGTPTRLTNGNAGQFLMSNGTTLAPSWASLASPVITPFPSSGTLTITGTPLYMIVEICGGGGQGGGSGASAGSGQPGSVSSFGSLLTANPGNGGGANGGSGGTGGSVGTVNTPAVALINLPGSDGGSADGSGVSTSFTSIGYGGSGPWGSGNGTLQGTGSNANANSGSGSSGAGTRLATTGSGGGGGAGNYIKAYIPSPSGSYVVTIGIGGTGGGGGGTNGASSGDGGSGFAIAYVYYQ